MARNSIKVGWLAFLFGLPVIAGVSTGVATDDMFFAIIAIVIAAVVALTVIAKLGPDLAGS